MIGMRRHMAVGSVVAFMLLMPMAPLQAQGRGTGDGWRVGVTMGGISTVGLSFELYRDARSLDLTLGTFGFRDLGLSAVVKQYFRENDVRPYLGAGLWLVVEPAGDEERTGLGLVARMPIGVDWRILQDHSVGAAIAINRALAVRRPDPTDDRPLDGRLVPLPGLYYRWAP